MRSGFKRTKHKISPTAIVNFIKVNIPTIYEYFGQYKDIASSSDKKHLYGGIVMVITIFLRVFTQKRKAD